MNNVCFLSYLLYIYIYIYQPQAKTIDMLYLKDLSL